jgi:hypothetical protein
MRSVRIEIDERLAPLAVLAIQLRSFDEKAGARWALRDLRRQRSDPFGQAVVRGRDAAARGERRRHH